MDIVNLDIDRVRIDGDTQPRAEINTDAVSEYAESVLAGRWDDFTEDVPKAMYDGKDYWLYDGFHRWHGFRKAKCKTMRVLVSSGTVEDARIAACATNQRHGLKRTNADKRRAVEMMLALRADWSDRRIAEHVGVAHPMVGEARKRLEETTSQPTRLGKDDRPINTTNIGKTPDPKKQPEEYAKVAHERGDSLQAIAAVVGVNKSTVKRWLDRCTEGEDRCTTPDNTVSDPAPNTPPAGTPSSAPDEDTNPVPEGNPDAPKDTLGIPIQPHAAEAFACAGQFDALVAKLKECAKELHALVNSHGGGHLKKAGIQWIQSSKDRGRWTLNHLQNAIKTVANSKPHVTDCPYAFNNSKHPHPENCLLCHNLRWLASLKGHQIPPSLTEAMKAHYGVNEEAK